MPWTWSLPWSVRLRRYRTIHSFLSSCRPLHQILFRCHLQGFPLEQPYWCLWLQPGTWQFRCIYDQRLPALRYKAYLRLQHKHDPWCRNLLLQSDELLQDNQLPDPYRWYWPVFPDEGRTCQPVDHKPVSLLILLYRRTLLRHPSW